MTFSTRKHLDTRLPKSISTGLAAVLALALLVGGCSSSDDTSVAPLPTEEAALVPDQNADTTATTSSEEDTAPPSLDNADDTPASPTTPNDSMGSSDMMEPDSPMQPEETESALLLGIQKATNEEIQTFLSNRGLQNDPGLVVSESHPLAQEVLMISNDLMVCIYRSWIASINSNGADIDTFCVQEWETSSSEPLRIISSLDVDWQICNNGSSLEHAYQTWEDNLFKYFEDVQIFVDAYYKNGPPIPENTPTMHELEQAAIPLTICGVLFGVSELISPDVGLLDNSEASIFISIGVITRMFAFAIHECDHHDTNACNLLLDADTSNAIELSDKIA